MNTIEDIVSRNSFDYDGCRYITPEAFFEWYNINKDRFKSFPSCFDVFGAFKKEYLRMTYGDDYSNI